MSPRLVPVNSNNVGTISLQRPVLFIGRHPECDVRIELPTISRRHCCIAQAYGRITLRDLGSRNGIRVNGRVVDEFVLQPGDELAIAQVIFRVEDDASQRPAQAPAANDTEPQDPPPILSDDDLIPIDL